MGFSNGQTVTRTPAFPPRFVGSSRLDPKAGNLASIFQ
jgi:hypothetical protein